jgi:hypothetical protein
VCSGQVRPEHDIFLFVVFLDKLMKYWLTLGYLQFLIDCEAGLIKYWFAYTILIDSQQQQNFYWELGLANKIVAV